MRRQRPVASSWVQNETECGERRTWLEEERRLRGRHERWQRQSRAATCERQVPVGRSLVSATSVAWSASRSVARCFAQL